MLLATVILLVSTISTLTAFGGKTWVEGTDPLPRRITKRGYTALVCLLLSLTLGIWKEHSSRIKSASDAQDARQRQEDLKNQLTAAQGQLELTKALLTDADNNLKNQSVQLGIANGSLSGVQGKLDLTKDQLNSTKATLSAVQQNLSQAQDMVLNANNAQVLSSLSFSGRKVSTIDLQIPLSAGTPTSEWPSEVFLPDSLVDCPANLAATVSVGGMTSDVWRRNDNKREQTVTDASFKSRAWIAEDLKDAERALPFMKKLGVAQETTNGNAYTYEVKFSKPDMDAATLLTAYQMGVQPPLRIDVRFPEKTSANANALRICGAALTKYIASIASYALFVVILDGTPEMSLGLALKAMPPVISNSGVAMKFEVVSSYHVLAY